MKIELDENELKAFLTLKSMLKNVSTPTPDFLSWVADRLVMRHGDDDNADFVIKLREYAKDTASICQLLGIKHGLT